MANAKKKDIVIIECYGEERSMEREEAKEFFKEAMDCSDGNEWRRYRNIYEDLCAGLDRAYDREGDD